LGTVAAVGGALLAIAVVLPGCTDGSAEAQVRKTVENLQSAVENRDSAAVLDLLADNFTASDGSERRSAESQLADWFARYQDVFLVVNDLTININPEDPMRAVMAGRATLAAGRSVLPVSLRSYRFSGEWWLEQEQWRLVRLDWH